jgi:hypothetical protein
MVERPTAKNLRWVPQPAPSAAKPNAEIVGLQKRLATEKKKLDKAKARPRPPESQPKPSKTEFMKLKMSFGWLAGRNKIRVQSCINLWFSTACREFAPVLD